NLFFFRRANLLFFATCESPFFCDLRIVFFPDGRIFLLRAYLPLTLFLGAARDLRKKKREMSTGTRSKTFIEPPGRKISAVPHKKSPHPHSRRARALQSVHLLLEIRQNASNVIDRELSSDRLCSQP
ncbi:MAG: hypothetical protein BJ554DRAFT_7607, partial [Olpidium bornovanus]